MSAEAAAYKVGRGRPPLETRFTPGVSGNPRGRPRGSRGVSAVIAAALAEKVTVTENGKRRSISKLEAAAKQLANKAAGGDAKAAKLIIDLLHQSETRDEARGADVPLAQEAQKAADLALLAAFTDHARQALVEAKGDPDA
jgi:hypothetical protein